MKQIKNCKNYIKILQKKRKKKTTKKNSTKEANVVLGHGLFISFSFAVIGKEEERLVERIADDVVFIIISIYTVHYMYIHRCACVVKNINIEYCISRLFFFSSSFSLS